MRKNNTTFTAYIKKIEKALERGDATEHTHRPALKTFLESFQKDVLAVNEPKKTTEAGKPDFSVFLNNAPVGYIETKDVGKDLDEAEKSEQILRYRKALPSFILTNYLEFRWYVDEDIKMTACLGRANRDGKIKPDSKGLEVLEELLRTFLDHRAPDVASPHDLARRMARMAHFVRDLILGDFRAAPDEGPLHQQYQAFKKMLIPDLKPEGFADMYAQTIAYGLFAARAVAKPGQPFTRQAARDLIPPTNPFLRKVFDRIAGADLPENISWLVDDLARLLDRADMAAILKNFGRAKRQEDPVVYFYEDFLAAFDPALREKRGVFYTPAPVVSYIVRSVDHVLKKALYRPDGFADPSIFVLDPATGTGSFLYAVINSIHDAVKAKGQGGIWDDVVTREILPRIFGFELLMAPYAVAHLKLGLQLKDLGYRFQSNQRLGVYLTNTLEEAVKKSEQLYESYIAEESHEAAEIKREKPIMVVLGNPPYSGISSNTGEWITGLIEDYKVIDGKPLGERKTWLQDDYVKFIRFGQWRIQKTGQGVLAFVTNHGYLDNPTFRGMRQSLINSFDEIYILDLHGNSNKKETAPDGSPDKNVFDIQPGVSVGIFVKQESSKGPAQVFHADLWGSREGKYKVLTQQALPDVKWKKLTPKSPFYFFVPKDNRLGKEYEQGWKITDIFPVNSTGIVTARDHFVIDFDEEKLKARINEFVDPKTSDQEIRRKYFEGCGSDKYEDGDTRGWKLPEARKNVRDDKDWQKRFQKVLYRPFDERSIYFTPWMVDWPRPEVMRHMVVEKNIALIFMRQVALNEGYSHFGVSNAVVDNRTFYSNKGIMAIAPLWLYPQQGDLLAGTGKEPNLNPKFLKKLKEGLGTIPAPEEIFYYIYAVFHSPTYRERYEEFLKIDFPRVPLTADKKLFKTLAAKGEELASLHLLESPALSRPIAAFNVSGSRDVEKVFYDENKKRIYINKTQYFDSIPSGIWEFQIGGYQVCEKWLKDRKERKLSAEDVRHYQKVVAAIHHTIRLMAEIDDLIPKWPIA
ncbi:MAG TPA: N-6 DNA methylase [Elusimicrobiota bacterium]|nr:N-6 DNA methylase [Elusimicrobiota bacterium]